MLNEAGTAVLRVEPGRVVYDQTWQENGTSKNVVQVYTFGAADVRASGPDHYDLALAFQSISGDTDAFSPDRNNVKIVAQRGSFGWELDLTMTDTSDRGIGIAFTSEPVDGLQPHLSGIPGTLPPPPDVAAPPRDAEQTPSGLSTKVLRAGTGADHPGPRDVVKVHYTEWTREGRMVDSTVVRDSPASFRVDQLIKGWTEGISLMVLGERRRLWIPSDLAFGDTPRGDQPAGDLVVDVELLAITPAVRPPPVPADVGAPPPNARRTRSGLAYRVLKKGAGKQSPTLDQRALVHYTGWTTDGVMFDSSVTREAPATFPLKGVIKGWTEGLQLMKVGDVVRFWIPPDLAYGTNARAGAPAGMLVFDIELLGIR
jgi:peptidylprolyl isomerase